MLRDPFCSGISCILIHFCFPNLSQERRDGHRLSSRCSFIWRHSYVLFSRNPRSVSNEAVCGYGCRYTSVTQRCVLTSSKDLNKYSEFVSGSDRIHYFSAIWFMSSHSPLLIVLRDISERGRDLEQVLNQYITFVKPAFEEFCLPVSFTLFYHIWYVFLCNLFYIIHTRTHSCVVKLNFQQPLLHSSFDLFQIVVICVLCDECKWTVFIWNGNIL